ncbi:MAG: radical SAM protein [Deltaproteobacteria bacterium]|nr:radical SAM protein [Deltaproteobacteria bacterium]
MNAYVQSRELKHQIRLPLEGYIDLTYRCNNNCRHCWLQIPPSSPEKDNELTCEEIKQYVDEARVMGCRRWLISGGEPMLREDFAEIFDYITRKSASYLLNTNGTLITPSIARIMKRKGNKLVALYGATAEVNDAITRTPGSFAAAMRGFSYLKEAGVGFTVQLIVMRDNYHQFQEMTRLAESLSAHWRTGASWFYLSASGDPVKNAEIKAQRLLPKEVFAIEDPRIFFAEDRDGDRQSHPSASPGDDRLFAACIAARDDFHIDPYGQMAFCSFIKDPAFRYDLRKGSFRDCWEVFIPALGDVVRGGGEYKSNCASCAIRKDCAWCPVYGYLEHRRFSAKVEYLCELAQAGKEAQTDWETHHRRYYAIAGIPIRVEADIPIKDDTFAPTLKPFAVDGPGADMITITHHFSLPDLANADLGKAVYRRPPWAIYRKGNAWIYLGISSAWRESKPYQVAVFSHDHTRCRIYTDGEEFFRSGNLSSLTLFPTDQILLARVLADRDGCYLHASGLVLNGKGLLFVGHSGAGKSTMVKMLRDEAEILCDDRIIIRRWPDGYRIHGTWSHGEVPEVSAGSALLRAVLFLEKATENLLIPLDDRKERTRRLLACVIRPFTTVDWWEKTLTVVEQIAGEVPCYLLRFDTSAAVVDVLKGLS